MPLPGNVSALELVQNVALLLFDSERSGKTATSNEFALHVSQEIARHTYTTVLEYIHSSSL